MGEDKSSKKDPEQDRLDKIQSLQEMIATAEKTITSAKQMLGQVQGSEGSNQNQFFRPSSDVDGQVIHGNFDGQIMIGDDGKQYPVPANYASKSKLVEGDLLKLTITEDGSFVYKQIGPAQRKYLIGIVKQDEKGNYFIKTDNKTYQVLLAAATYFKIEPEDEVTIIIPKDKDSVWSAIENIVRKSTEPQAFEKEMIIPKISNPENETEKEDENTTEIENDEINDKDQTPSALERLEKEIEDERKRQTSQDTILDEWTPNIEEMKKETKKKATATIE